MNPRTTELKRSPPVRLVLVSTRPRVAVDGSYIMDGFISFEDDKYYLRFVYPQTDAARWFVTEWVYDDCFYTPLPENAKL